MARRFEVLLRVAAPSSGALLAAAMLWTDGALAQSAPAKRSRQDQQILTRLEYLYPGATKELEAGEALLRGGQNAKAADYFRELAKRYPDAGLTERRYCQALTRLGRRSEAMEACQNSIARLPSSESSRAMVAAMMLGPPTSMDVNQAVRLATTTVSREPNEPWGYAAKFDIAERLEDYAMEKQSLEQLERFAPGHAETVRAKQIFGRPRVPRTVVVGWLAVGLAALVTLAHALWRLTRRASGGVAPAAAAFALLLLLPTTGHAADEAATVHTDGVPAGGLSSFKIDRNNPSANIPSVEARNKDPLNFGYYLMDLSDLGFEASKKGEYAKAAQYWIATARAVPTAAIGFRNACDNLAKAGDVQQALVFCRAALGTPGVKLSDHEALAKLLLDKPEPMTTEEITDISEMVKHLRTQPGGATLAEQMLCDLGTKLEDPARLTECTDALIQSNPNDAKTITYKWALAIAKGDLADARAQIERGKKAGIRADGIKTMQEGLVKASSLGMRFKRNQRVLTGAAAVLGLVGLLAGLLTLRRRRSRPLAVSASSGTSVSAA